MDYFQDFFQTDAGKIIFTGFISMLPVIELRGAIPVGIGMGLNVRTAYIVSVIGNMLPVPFIILFIRQIFEFIKRKENFLSRFVNKLEKKADVKSKTIYRSELIGLFIFVAIPLPGTGAWTGALIAAFLSLRFKTSIPAIFLGVLTAGVIVSVLTQGVTALIT